MSNAPFVSVVIPAYNVSATISETLDSALAQTFADIEVIVVDDGSTDETPAIVRARRDPRLRLVSQANRGLAGARNTGIFEARGQLVALLDGDDLWRRDKIEAHVRHMEGRPDLGLSFSASAMIDGKGAELGLVQRGALTGIDPATIIRRNPVGNGSAPVLRRAALDAIAHRPDPADRPHWFDESFRQSEDIECWLRLALTTSWRIEGLAAPLTRYRINPGGLSADAGRQLESWERMIAKTAGYAPDFVARHAPAARAYQLRYLARRAVSARDGGEALRLMRAALGESREPLTAEPAKTLTTLAAAGVLRLMGRGVYRGLESALFALRRADAARA